MGDWCRSEEQARTLSVSKINPTYVSYINRKRTPIITTCCMELNVAGGLRISQMQERE